MEPISYTSLERCITFYYCKSTLGVVTYIFFLSSFFLPFGFLLFIFTADPVSFARFLRKRISSTTVKALSFSRSEFIILSRAQRADHARIASELRFRFGHLSIGFFLICLLIITLNNYIYKTHTHKKKIVKLLQEVLQG